MFHFIEYRLLDNNYKIDGYNNNCDKIRAITLFSLIEITSY